MDPNYPQIEEVEESATGYKEENSPRIGLVSAIILVGFGFLIDVLQFLLGLTIVGIVLNYLIGGFTWITIYVWLKIKGISMWEERVGFRILMSLLFAAGLEILTAGVAPGWGIFTVSIVVAEYSRRVSIVKSFVNEK